MSSSAELVIHRHLHLALIQAASPSMFTVSCVYAELRVKAFEAKLQQVTKQMLTQEPVLIAAASCLVCGQDW